jgi:adenosylhomocysteine nucleosidase
MILVRSLILIGIISISVPATQATAEVVEPVTGVLGAFAEEIHLLEQHLTERQETRILGLRFLTGRIGGRKIVLALSGVGKVNAAMTTTLLIEHFKPNELIFTGVAGALSPDLQPGDIIIGTKTSQHDYGWLTDGGIENKSAHNPINGKRNPVFFPADPSLLELARLSAKRVEFEKINTGDGQRTPKVIEGIIATGDVFVASATRRAEICKRVGADAVEMEGAAVAQICWELGVPCIVIRSISDLADERAIKDCKLFYKVAAHNSSGLVEKMLTELKSRSETGDPATRQSTPSSATSKPAHAESVVR